MPVPKSKRITTKHHAQSIGKNFESIFSQMCSFQNIICTRIPDSCKQLGPKIIRVVSPFDFVITSPIHGHAFIDTKTTHKDAFYPSQIHDYQVKTLARHSINKCKAGYVIHFQPSDQVIFINGSTLMQRYLNKVSITPTDIDVIKLGTLSRLDINNIFLVEFNYEPDSNNPQTMPPL